MAKELVNALLPIFAGLLLGFWAGRRGLMDNVNVRNLVALVMNIAAPCALFLIIINTSRAILQQQIWTSLAITLTFVRGSIHWVLFLGTAQYKFSLGKRRNRPNLCIPQRGCNRNVSAYNHLWAWSSCTGSPLHRYGSSRYIPRHVSFVGG
jgi:predicted permease